MLRHLIFFYWRAKLLLLRASHNIVRIIIEASIALRECTAKIVECEDFLTIFRVIPTGSGIICLKNVLEVDVLAADRRRPTTSSWIRITLAWGRFIDASTWCLRSQRIANHFGLLDHQITAKCNTIVLLVFMHFLRLNCSHTWLWKLR